MKKKSLYIIAIFITAFLIFKPEVKAVNMLFQCSYTNECTENSIKFYDDVSLSRWCHKDFKTYGLATNNDGNLVGLVFTSLDDADTDYKKIQTNCWLKDGMSNKSCKDKNKLDRDVMEIYTSNICPSLVVNDNTFRFFADTIGRSLRKYGYEEKYNLTLVGEKGTKMGNTSNLTDDRYIIYSFRNQDGDNQIIAEGYNADGKYGFLGSNIKTKFWEYLKNDDETDELLKYSADKITMLKGDYFKVDTVFKATIIGSNTKGVSFAGMNVCRDLTEEECAEKQDYKVIIDSNDSTGTLKKAVKEWYEDNLSNMSNYNELANLVKNEKFINTCEKIKTGLETGEKYEFSSAKEAEEIVDNIEKGYELLEKSYGKDNTFKDYATGKGTSANSSATSYIYKNYLNDIKEFKDIAEKDSKENRVNGGLIVKALYDDVADEIKRQGINADSNIIDISNHLNSYTEVFYTALAYLNSNSELLSPEYKQKIKDLMEKYEILVEDNNLNINPVVDCKSLLGERLIKKIQGYTNIVKIAIPIILIVFGIIDFVQATFSVDENKMKEAQKKFIRRIIIAILIFLVPSLVNLLLKIANEVWGVIQPDSCGIF